MVRKAANATSSGGKINRRTFNKNKYRVNRFTSDSSLETTSYSKIKTQHYVTDDVSGETRLQQQEHLVKTKSNLNDGDEFQGNQVGHGCLFRNVLYEHPSEILARYDVLSEGTMGVHSLSNTSKVIASTDSSVIQSVTDTGSGLITLSVDNKPYHYGSSHSISAASHSDLSIIKEDNDQNDESDVIVPLPIGAPEKQENPFRSKVITKIEALQLARKVQHNYSKNKIQPDRLTQLSMANLIATIGGAAFNTDESGNHFENHQRVYKRGGHLGGKCQVDIKTQNLNFDGTSKQTKQGLTGLRTHPFLTCFACIAPARLFGHDFKD